MLEARAHADISGQLRKQLNNFLSPGCHVYGNAAARGISVGHKAYRREDMGLSSQRMPPLVTFSAILSLCPRAVVLNLVLASRSPGGLTKIQTSGPRLRISDSAGLWWGQEFAFLTSLGGGGAVLMLLVRGPHFENFCTKAQGKEGYRNPKCPFRT